MQPFTSIKPLVVVATASLLLIASGCSRDTTAETRSAETEAVQTANIGQNSSTNPFRDAVNKAMAAAELAQTAKTPEEWANVAQSWQQAITLMKAVPESSSNYTTAQQKAVEYQPNLDYAQRNAGTASSSVPASSEGNVSNENNDLLPEVEALLGTEYAAAQMTNLVEQYGVPETLPGTDDSTWVAYFPEGNFTIATDKQTNIIYRVIPGKVSQEEIP